MKAIKFIVAIVIALSFTSCGIADQLTRNQNQNSTTVVLSESNYTVVKNVEASVSDTYIFGIGGLNKKHLLANSMDELTKKADLQGSQALINVTTKFHVQTVLGIWTKITYISHGTVIEFQDK